MRAASLARSQTSKPTTHVAPLVRIARVSHDARSHQQGSHQQGGTPRFDRSHSSLSEHRGESPGTLSLVIAPSALSAPSTPSLAHLDRVPPSDRSLQVMGQLRKSKTATQFALSSLHMLEQTGERVSHVGALVTHEVADKVRCLQSDPSPRARRSTLRWVRSPHSIPYLQPSPHLPPRSVLSHLTLSSGDWISGWLGEAHRRHAQFCR